MKKIKITESQLKKLLSEKHTYLGDNNSEETETETNEVEDISKEDELDEQDEEEIEVEEECSPEQEKINESIEKIKANFKRFL